MTVAEVREKYLSFFKKHGHVIVPSASLVPENDPTTLFTGSGMQPMVPYLLGETHPLGRRIADSQKAFRTQDIEEVGDNRHTTFFEMLGNWSLGDYFKEEQLSWIFRFLTKELNLSPSRLYFSVFSGDTERNIPRDTESVEILKGLFAASGIEAKDIEILTEEQGGRQGMRGGRIFYYDAKKNWWSRSGTPEHMPVGEPGGPDSEIFFDFHPEAGERCIQAGFGEYCHPNCDCGRFMEIGNSVFMEYRKAADSREQITGRGEKFERLPQRNVDFGGGLERIVAASLGNADVFEIDVFKMIIRNLESFTEKKYSDPLHKRSYRIVADHIRAAVFLMADGVLPSNTDRGYFVRRLLRRAIVHLDKLEMEGNQLHNPLDTIAELYKSVYPNLLHNKGAIEDALNTEEQQFRKTLARGMREFEKKFSVRINTSPVLTGLAPHVVFELITTYGFPPELVKELAKERGIEIDDAAIEREMDRHRAVSRAGIQKKFKGGLVDTSEMSVKYHTATHLLHQALREVLGGEVRQKGSNITPERLRLDFAFARKMTEEEKRKVEEIVNQKIADDLPVHKISLPLEEAKKSGALHFFDAKYPDEVLVHYVGKTLEDAYSKEFCGGPHVEHTGVLGTFKISKEEAVSAGVRRIKAVLEK